MPAQPYPQANVIEPTKENIKRFARVITDAFQATALTTAFICGIDNTPPPYPSPLIDSARRLEHFGSGIFNAAESNAIFVEAGDWSAIALWEPPDFQGKPFSEVRPNPGPLLTEWREKVRKMKEKHLAVPAAANVGAGVEGQVTASAGAGTEDPETTLSVAPTQGEVKLRPFWHLSFLARNPKQPAVKGAISAVLKPYIDKAVEKGVPCWLEATYPHAVEVYKHMGFRLVETVTVGKGKIASDGWPREGGEGVTAYGMIFDPHLRSN